jgi:LysM repeat protein
VSAVRHRPLVLVPMEPVRSVFECAPACQEFTEKRRQRQVAPCLPEKAANANISQMKLLLLSAFVLIVGEVGMSSANGQSFARSPSEDPTAAQLSALTKKIEEQNTKIDTLSQQILKLEQQLTTARPGVIIGEATPTPAPPSAVTSESTHPATGNTHTVARGETLTSIAKMHNVTVSDLQKFNHIENDRKLQIGQTIMIPTAPTPAASATPND